MATQEGSKTKRRIQYLVILSVSLAMVNLGVSSSWSTPVMTKLKTESDIDITDTQISLMLSMSAPGFLIGSLATKFIADSCGRKTTILASALPILTGTLLVCFARVWWLLLITRFLWGCGTGMIGCVINIYIAEITDKEIRGSLSLVTRFMFNFGSLLVITIGPFVHYRVLNYSLLALPIVFFVACWWIPESPYYYLKEDRMVEAKKSFMKLKGIKNAEDAEDELAIIKTNVKGDMTRSATIKELFTGKQYRKAILIALGLKCTDILTGTITIQNYLGQTIKDSQFLSIKASTQIVIFGIVKFIAGIMSSILVDRVGRRPLLITSFFGYGLLLTIVGAYFFCLDVLKIDSAILSPYASVSFFGIVLTSIVSTLGYSSIVGLITAEIFPLNIRMVAQTFLGVCGGLIGTAVPYGYQLIKDLVGNCGVFWFFSAVAFTGTVFCIIFVPETKGKSLEEIQKMMQGVLYCKEDAVLNKKTNECVEYGENNEMEILNKKKDDV